ncbi:DUF222 domain-containing protein, partial [Mycobacterium sp. NAZ190054]|uniref:DUF222 domain-containing protein n=1 Tax=Mycobacterium sp. NAZ190054 TaxID=1747766 RepID=UPI000AF89105
SRKSVIDAIDAEVIALDPDAAKHRRQKAYDERAVHVETGLDGMGWLRARMSATQAAAWDTKLSAMASAVCPADPRTLLQRRADALDALRDGLPFTCACTTADCPTRTTTGQVEPAAPARGSADAEPAAPVRPGLPVPAGASVVLHVIEPSWSGWRPRLGHLRC